jgi:catechol 2,3-dioxygenase-like lactoylglutathione lyase family enzyme
MAATRNAISGVAVVSVPVSDQDRARDFYVEKLGFELVQDRSLGDMRWVQVRPPGSPTSLTLVTWFPTMPAGSLKGLVLETENVQAAYETLRGRGVEVAHEPKQEFWGTYTALDDPDGNGLVLSQPPGD